MKIITLIPFQSVNNNYIHRVKYLILNGATEEYHLSPFPKKKKIIKKLLLFFTVLNKKPIDVIILNWHENLLKSKNNKISILGLVKFFAYFLVYKLFSRNIVYVRHNVYPHGMKGMNAKLARNLTNLAERFSDAKVTHSGHLVEFGYTYIPHPLYSFPDSVRVQPRVLANTRKTSYYIIFGRIERYKKIEKIIDLWESDTLLLVVGPSNDAEYLSELQDSAKSKNIVFDARFIDETEAQNLVAKAEGMILSHADPDMIVSGSFFYAATLGTPVHAVEKPFFNWLKNEEAFDGLYIYKSPAKLVRQLNSKQVDNSFYTNFDRNNIRRQAETLFGDTVTRNAWRDLLIRITQ